MRIEDSEPLVIADGDVRKGADLQDRCFDFACRIVALNDALAKRGPSARSIGSQLLRSGTSIGANVEEADAGQSRADFLSKLTIALKEARESYYWIRLLVRTGKLRDEDHAESLMTEANRLVAILTSIIRNTKDNQSSKEVSPRA